MKIDKIAMLNEKMFNHIYRGECDKVKECLENGADVNAKERFGNSTLISAVSCGYTEIAKLLIEHGADINIENDKGITALDLAKDNNKIKNLLKPKVMAKTKQKSNDLGLGM